MLPLDFRTATKANAAPAAIVYGSRLVGKVSTLHEVDDSTANCEYVNSRNAIRFMMHVLHIQVWALLMLDSAQV